MHAAGGYPQGCTDGLEALECAFEAADGGGCGSTSMRMAMLPLARALQEEEEEEEEEDA